MTTELSPALYSQKPAGSLDALWKLPPASADPSTMFDVKDFEKFVTLLVLPDDSEHRGENTGAHVIASMDVSRAWSVVDNSGAAIVQYESMREELEELMIAQEAYGHYRQTPFEDTISFAEYAEQWLAED